MVTSFLHVNGSRITQAFKQDDVFDTRTLFDGRINVPFQRNNLAATIAAIRRNNQF
jgi:hypothetical protein